MKALQSHEIRRDPQQPRALAQRFEHEPELSSLQVTQATVNELARAARRARRERALLEEQHGVSGRRCGLCNADAVYSAADDDDVVTTGHRACVPSAATIAPTSIVST